MTLYYCSGIVEEGLLRDGKTLNNPNGLSAQQPGKLAPNPSTRQYRGG